MFDVTEYPYPSQRRTIHAQKGMVATSQPLAAQAGLDMLKKGGNAVDAAVAVAAALTVMEPTDNGIGGDMFALVHMNGSLYGLNGSGPAPMAISAEELHKKGHATMPLYGWAPVTVPGTPSAWSKLWKRFGRLSFTDVLAPAITYAEEGYPTSPNIGRSLRRSANLFKTHLDADLFHHWWQTFSHDGVLPGPAEPYRLPDHARTLRSIAETEAESFYRGELAEKIDAHARKSGGYIRKADLEAFEAEWIDPIRVHYRGYDVWEIPPNGQGLVALMALNMLKAYDVQEMDRLRLLHLQFEAMKIAFADGQKHITDPRWMSVNVDDLLSDDFAAERRQAITDQASVPKGVDPNSGGTVYCCTADGDGNMVSLIQSNYKGFGSGVVVPGTGIALQNRGNNFSLNREHANCLEPGKRTYHTIIPGFLTKDGEAIGPFGVMGGFMQPQGHVQVVMNMIDFGMNPQAALDAPRWQWRAGTEFDMEHNVDEKTVQALTAQGHIIHSGMGLVDHFGRGQIIHRKSNGVLIGATEPRADGTVASW